MLTVEQALQVVRDRARPLPPQRRPLAEALGCILAEDVAADQDQPPFDKALVDGYAVRSEDLASDGPHRLRVGQEIMAGQTPQRALAPGEAALIMTGAPLPPHADAVVMIERTRQPEPGVVIIDEPHVAPGQNRLPRGREMRAGDLLLRRGERLSAVRLGLLASAGRPEIQVIPRPRVAVLPTGDELVEPGSEPGPGQIRNSNGLMLAALARAADAEAKALPIARDERPVLLDALRTGLAQSDLLLVAGGVSAGQRDLVPAALEQLGIQAVFHKIRLKPGKPLWFGTGPPRGPDDPGPLVFGLPGNPVSGVVGFLLFVRPALQALAGQAPSGPAVRQARLVGPFSHRGDRPTYHPARLSGDPAGPAVLVETLDWAGSADLRTVALADGFAIFPAGDRDYPAGEVVEFMSMP